LTGSDKVLSFLPGFLSDRILKKVLVTKGMKADENAMYLYSNFIEMIWPYDDRGRLIGEDVWEPDPDKAELATWLSTRGRIHQKGLAS
jgi:hypothetical protein